MSVYAHVGLLNQFSDINPVKKRFHVPSSPLPSNVLFIFAWDTEELSLSENFEMPYSPNLLTSVLVVLLSIYFFVPVSTGSPSKLPVASISALITASSFAASAAVSSETPACKSARKAAPLATS